MESSFPRMLSNRLSSLDRSFIKAGHRSPEDARPR